MDLKLKSRFQYRSIMDMTPLIDLSFTLLIFFMISYNASQGKMSSIVVNLPRAVQTGEHRTGDIIVSITDKDEIFINDVRHNINSLPDEFAKIKKSLKDGTVVIRGDRKSNYETIVRVMDLLNQAGIPKFTLAAIKSK
jgi:biopolymer transport protein ExbD